LVHTSSRVMCESGFVTTAASIACAWRSRPEIPPATAPSSRACPGSIACRRRRRPTCPSPSTCVSPGAADRPQVYYGDLMGRVFSNTAAAFAAVTLSLTMSAAHGQSARSGGGASAQLMQQMQQLASERTSLQAENAKLKKDLEDMRKDRDALKKGQQALDRRAKTSEGSLKEVLSRRDTSEQELTQTKEKMQQLVAK